MGPEKVMKAYMFCITDGSISRGACHTAIFPQIYTQGLGGNSMTRKKIAQALFADGTL